MRLVPGLLMLCLLAQSAAYATGDDGRRALFDAFLERDFDAKARAVDELATAYPDATTRRILGALLNGDLYYVKDGGEVVFAERTDDGYRATDVLTGEALGELGRRDVKKVTVNNSLRTKLDGLLAGFDLTHPEPGRRLAAVRDMTGALDDDTAGLLAERVGNETDDAVREAMAVALALHDLKSGDPRRVEAAVESLETSLRSDVRSEMRAVHAATGDAELRERIALGIKRVDSRIAYYDFIEKVFFGLSLGSVLVLAAIGLAITFGVMGVLNMAHGELIMLGAYTTYVAQKMMPGMPGAALLASIPLAFIVAGLTGVAIERSVIRFLYGRPLETLLATFGISLILQQAVRSVFSPLNRSVVTPEWLSGSVQINQALSLTMNRLGVIVFCLLVFAALVVVLKRTALGLQIRAVSQNRDMARAMGVRSGRVDALTFGLGAGVAGIAGVALSQLTNVGPNLGQAYIVDSFMVVVFGGVGNLWGTLVGGMGLGILNKFLEPWAGAVLAKILVLVLLILFTQKRPRGLFPQRGRAVEA